MLARCDHGRLTWGCDPCRERVTTDQRLCEFAAWAEDDPSTDATGYLVEELDYDLGFADTAIWWPTITLHDVLRRLRETTTADWRSHCREMRRVHDIEPDPVRHSVLREAWRRRCAAKSPDTNERTDR